jgi:hypothetical protein
MVIIRSVSDTGLARGYYLWGPPTKVTPTQEEAGNKWFTEYIVNDRFTIKTVPEITARLNENVLTLQTSRSDRPEDKGSLELRPVWQFVGPRQDAEPAANAAKGPDIPTSKPADRNLFAAEAARKVATIGAEQELVLPVFSIDVTDAESRGANAKLIGVWSSKLGWLKGKGRHAMVIIKGVSDTGLVRGYYLWGPPGKQSPTKEAAGNKWFAEYMVNDKFTIKTVPEIEAKLDGNNVLTLRAGKGSVELRPVWQLVRVREDPEPSNKREQTPPQTSRRETPRTETSAASPQPRTVSGSTMEERYRACRKLAKGFAQREACARNGAI